MSYRTYINNKQIFGNNEYYPEWIDFIKSQGIEINEESGYTGEIKDFMGALETIENIILRLESERRARKEALDKEIEEKNLTKEEKEMLYSSVYGISSLFDFRHYYDEIKNEDKNDKYHTSLTDRLSSLRKEAYIFMSCEFIDACKDKIEHMKPFSVDGHFDCYKIKENEHIYVRAS